MEKEFHTPSTLTDSVTTSANKVTYIHSEQTLLLKIKLGFRWIEVIIKKAKIIQDT